ncbi:MAG: metal-dependent hydrolase [Planctomycetes bacterium]|nr:metal-dependent hydrolase [Planctomycetota bacterium]
MASLYTHAFAAVCLGAAISPRRVYPRVVLVGIVCSLVPDADVIAFYLGVPYEHVFGHRGLSHSLVFAAALSVFATAVLFREARWLRIRTRIAAYLFIVTGSHGLFDAMTNGGLGVAFFAPFADTRYFLPFRPVEVSPLGPSAFFNPRLLPILISEVIWIWIPWAGIATATYLGLRWSQRRASFSSAA